VPSAATRASRDALDPFVRGVAPARPWLPLDTRRAPYGSASLSTPTLPPVADSPAGPSGALAPGDDRVAQARASAVRALAEAAERRRFEDPLIREAVETYARRAREAGRTPEWLIIDLKRLVAHEAMPEVGDWFRSVVADRAVAWGIQGYFGLPTVGEGPLG